MGRKKVVETFEFDEAQFPTVDSVDEAASLYKAIVGNHIKDKAKRDSANSILQGFVVTFLRKSGKTNGALGRDIQVLKDALPKSNALTWGLKRVKAFRGKNPAWRTHAV